MGVWCELLEWVERERGRGTSMNGVDKSILYEAYKIGWDFVIAVEQQQQSPHKYAA